MEKEGITVLVALAEPDRAEEIADAVAEEPGMTALVRPDHDAPAARVRIVEDVPFDNEPAGPLVLLTDGVTEAMNPQNEIYGMSRLTKFLETAPDDADALGEALVEDVEAFSEGRAQRDDICLICFRRLPELP